MEKKSQRLKIAYYSKNDPLDKRSWSGTTYYMGQALQKHVGDVHFLGPVEFSKGFDKIIRGMAKFCRVFLKSNYVSKYSLLQNWYSVRQLKRKMKGRDYDCIVAPAASPELGLLKTDIPVITIGDATYLQYRTHYKKEFHLQNSLSRWEGEYLERKALGKSTYCVFSSHWAAQSAIEDYGIPEEKVSVNPLGANIDFTPARETIFEKVKNNTLTLLFLSVDWERKGGDIAFDTLVHLHQQGIKAKLIVCGCIPPPQFSHPYMEVIPFLNKNIREDHERFIAMLSSVHFLLLPTRADCSPIVTCEANSYGVPCVITNVGGVSDLIQNDVNGYCMSFGAKGDEYAAVIASIFTDKERYYQLIQTSRDRFDEELNWDAWAARFNVFYEEKFLLRKTVTARPIEQAGVEV